VALALLRRILGSDDQQLRDVRGMKNIGADAVDADQRPYELKTFAGAAPDAVSLTPSELKRALDPEFVLIVVSELEGANASPKIRVFVNPLQQLQISETSSVNLRGVLRGGGILYEFVEDESPVES